MRQQLAVDVHTHYFWVFSEEAREFRQKVGLGTIDGMRDSAGNVIGNAGGVPIVVYRDSIDIERQVETNRAAEITRRLLSVPMLIGLFSGGVNQRLCHWLERSTTTWLPW
jgi:hypothetical protein